MVDKNLQNVDRVELLIMGWIRLFIENQVDNIPSECKFICKDFFGALINSKILKIKEEELLLKYMHERTKMRNYDWKLIFRATEHSDPFAMYTFFKFCGGKSNTVIIVHNDYDQVFGGYTPCKWQHKDSGYAQIKDESLTTFLFILRTSQKHGPGFMTLKSGRKTGVSYQADGGTSFDFGCNDFYLYQQRVYAYGATCCFEWNGDEGMSYLGGPGYGSTPKEIEVYQLQSMD